MLVGGLDSLGAVVDAQLGIHRLDMRAHRVQRDHQLFGDLFILEPLRHQAQHVQLAGGQRGQQSILAARRSLRRPAERESGQDMARKALLSRAELRLVQPLLLEQERQGGGDRLAFIDEQADKALRLSQLQRPGIIRQAADGIPARRVHLSA